MLNVKKTLTHLLNNLLYRTQRGYYNSAAAIAAGGYADYTITFPKAYDNVPTVAVTLAVDSSSTSAENAKLEPFIISTTTSQVKIRVINSSSISRTPAFTWIAVGKIGGGYFLKAFTIFSRLAERWWEYAEHKEDSHQTDAHGWNKLHHILRNRCRVGFTHFVGNMGVHILVWNNLFCRAESNYFKGRKRIITDKCYYGRENNNTSDSKLLFYGKHEKRRLDSNRQGIALERGWSCA